jgi:hypothetical protein
MATAPQTSAASPIDTHAAPTSDTKSSSGKATAALVIGIVALLLFWVPIAAWILGAVGIGIAVAAKSDVANRGLGGAGQAKAGMILSILAIVLGTGIFVLALASAS